MIGLLEKIGLGLLISAWLIWGSTYLADTLVHSAPPSEKLAYATSDAPAATTSKAAPAESGDALSMLASADIARGKKVFKKCASCHSSASGAKNKIGPNLWGVVGRPVASGAGFKYSGALSGIDGNWDFAKLDGFLTSPKAFAKGNKMTFAGVKKASDRAAVMVFLRGLSQSPVPLP